MKNTIVIAILMLGIVQTMSAQTIRDTLIWLKLEPGRTTSIEGNLLEGSQMETLAWAWRSSVACFPETQKRKYTGNHVLYAAKLPARSEMKITVIPDNKNANFSLYAYEVGQVTPKNLVPNLSRCIRCEVDHKWDFKRRGKTQDHTRTVTDILAINNPYQVVIGVVGAEGLKRGGYTLQVSLQSR